MKPRIRAVVLDDASDGLRTHVFADFPVRIGRDETCELRLNHRRASRHHARIECVAGGLLVVDEGSLNGVLVNDVRIKPGAPAALSADARLALGPVTVMVHLLPPEPATPTGTSTPHVPTRGDRTTELSALPAGAAFLSSIAGVPAPSRRF
jgi:pSer/pThr/pTyr-binding forkhead associated (FHA) protein